MRLRWRARRGGLTAEITGNAESTIQRGTTNRRVCRSRGQVVGRIRSSGYVGPFHLEAMHSSVSFEGGRNPKQESNARHSIMSAAPRIAFKAKGRILFLDLAEIVAVQAEGNYVWLRHSPNPYLLRESLSSMAEKLTPYGFIRIHRSVVVNKFRGG
jgi:LytTr DNA-binding domain-containing protein